MRLWIRIVVIAAHVALILLIVGPCRHTCWPWKKSSPAPADRKTENPAPDSRDTTAGKDATPTTKPPPEISGSSRSIPPYSATFFTEARIDPSPALRKQIDICRTGVLVDWSRRRLLWGKKETKAVPIASLTKMMTALLLMEAIRDDPALRLDKKIQVTREAAAVGGRQVWLDPRESFPLQDILRAMMIHSANDAAFLISQTVAGSETEFVKRMNRRAKTLGLHSFVFHNAHGLPEGPTREENMGSAIELAYLAGRLLAYDDVTRWTSTRLSYLEPRIDGKKTQLLNTNKLVGRVPGVNGMKTGYTSKSGYCLTATCNRDNRKIIVVVTGCARGTERDKLAAALIEWGYAHP